MCIDDAHGVGVLGETGRGTAQHFSLSSDNIFFTGTLSKAFGAFGGFIPADFALAEKTARNAGVIRGASWPSVPAVAAAGAVLRLLKDNPSMLKALRANVKRARGGLRQLGLEIADSPVPIISVRAPVDLKRVYKSLRDNGIVVRYLEPSGYSDAPPVETLRIAIFSTHSNSQSTTCLKPSVSAFSACVRLREINLSRCKVVP